MPYTIKTFMTRSGERFSQLYDTETPGLPLFYPTAFVARFLRSATHETQKVYLAVIKRICEWEFTKQVDLANCFHRSKFLTCAQIDDLANHLRASKLGGKGEVIGSPKYNTYVAYATEYLRWLAQEVITDWNTVNVRASIEAQSDMLLKKKIRKSGSKSSQNRRVVTKSLTTASSGKLLSLFEQPFEGITRTQDLGSRIRNIVMLRILYETGMRVGELLGLKLKNFSNATGEDSATLEITRNHHDEFDSRLNQPVAKTLGRTLPISESLEAQLDEYCNNWRAEVEGVGFSDEDFIFVIHRAGRTLGQALPKSSFDSGLSNLKKSFPALTPIHPHLLRHDWNYRFSMKVDAIDMSFEEERQLREYLMGWAPGSAMSNRYNYRHVQEKSLEVGLSIASDSARGLQ